MANLKYKTRVNSDPKGKPRLYFCCSFEDFDKYFESVSDEILSKQNCTIWYTDEEIVRDEDFFADLKQMQLFVMPVTTSLLCTENEALNTEFKFAIENHIPVLPLMQESGLEELFNKKCGDLQFLDKNNTDTTAISYDEKLKKYLESVLIGDELAEKIRAAFDAYVFMSYRKKDRRYAQELMRLIHKNEFCRDIAIWYDEFLTPGENFNDSIKEALQKSGLFVLTVTPNLINEPNYIMTTEYPMARQEGKPILPAELVPTDREQLSEKYEDIPNPADAHNESELSEALLDSIKKMAIKENDKSPEHNYFIGLAYLGGVDVEVDYERAVALITNAAESGLIEAADKLYDMYLNGCGVERNYESATKWFSKKIDLLREAVDENECQENYKELISEMDLFAQHYARMLGNDCEVKKIYFDLVEICEKAYNKFKTLHFKRKLGLSYVRMAQSHMNAKEYELAIQKIAEAEELYKGIKEEQLKEITDNWQTSTIGQWLDYYMSYNDIAFLYEGLAEVAQKKGEHENEEKYLLRCLELRSELANHIKENAIIRLNVATSYLALANHYKLRGNLSEAIACYDKGYSLASEIGDETGYLYAGEITVRFNMLRAEIHIQQNENEKAIKCYMVNIVSLEASKLSPEMIKLKAENYYQASKQSYNMEEFEQATIFITKYLHICRQTNDAKQYAEIFGRELEYLTDCNIKAGNSDEAIKIHAELLENKRLAYQQTKSDMTAMIYSVGLMGMGDIYLRCQDYRQAQNSYRTTLNFAESLKAESNVDEETPFAILVKTYIKMAKMYEIMNCKSKTRKCFQQAIRIAKTSLKRHRAEGTYRQLFETYGKMGDWYKSVKQYKLALKCYSDAIYLAEESVMVYQDEADKKFLAAAYLVAGTLPDKKNDLFLKKSMILWQELIQTDPSSRIYQDGYKTVCQALNSNNNSYSKDLIENHTMTLTDENGNEETYELLDLIVESDIEYAVFMSVDYSETEVLILRVEESDKDEDRTSYSVIDDELVAKIFEIFKERNKDIFNFVD